MVLITKTSYQRRHTLSLSPKEGSIMLITKTSVSDATKGYDSYLIEP